MIFLGTSAAVPTVERDNSAFLLTKPLLMIDCPGSPVQKLKRAGVDFRGLGHLFLTHRHVDHLYGLVSLVHCLGEGKLFLWGSPQTLEVAHLALKAHGLWGGKVELRLCKLPSDGEGRWEVEGLELRSFPVPHVVGSLGLCLRLPAGKLVISGDCAPGEEVARWARGARWLIHDCAGTGPQAQRLADLHTPAEELGRIAARAGVKTLIPIHIPEEASEEKVRKELRHHFRGEILIPRDLQRLRLD